MYSSTLLIFNKAVFTLPQTVSGRRPYEKMNMKYFAVILATFFTMLFVVCCDHDTSYVSKTDELKELLNRGDMDEIFAYLWS